VTTTKPFARPNRGATCKKDRFVTPPNILMLELFVVDLAEPGRERVVSLDQAGVALLTGVELALSRPTNDLDAD
jgi:hypothetical protein